MYFETWAIVFMGLGGLSLWALLVMMVMAVLIAGSKADDRVYGERQYHE